MLNNDYDHPVTPFRSCLQPTSYLNPSRSVSLFSRCRLVIVSFQSLTRLVPFPLYSFPAQLGTVSFPSRSSSVSFMSHSVSVLFRFLPAPFSPHTYSSRSDSVPFSISFKSSSPATLSNPVPVLLPFTVPFRPHPVSFCDHVFSPQLQCISLLNAITTIKCKHID